MCFDIDSVFYRHSSTAAGGDYIIYIIIYTSACQILSRSENLRQVEQFKSVYVCPDRSHNAKTTCTEYNVLCSNVLDLKRKQQYNYNK